MRRWWIVVTLALHEVGPVDRARGHVDEHFAGAQPGIGNFAHLEHLRRTGASDHGGAHAVNLRLRLPHMPESNAPPMILG